MCEMKCSQSCDLLSLDHKCVVSEIYHFTILKFSFFADIFWFLLRGAQNDLVLFVVKCFIAMIVVFIFLLCIETQALHEVSLGQEPHLLFVYRYNWFHPWQASFEIVSS